MSTMSNYELAKAVSGEISVPGGVIAYDFPAGLVTATEETAPALAYLASVGIAKEANAPTEVRRSKSAKDTSTPVGVNIESTEE